MLATAIPRGCKIVCYADDTLVLAEGKSLEVATSRANVAIAGVVNTIKRLGLRIATYKTEALVFGKRTKFDEKGVEVDETKVFFKRTMKYLELMIDRE